MAENSTSQALSYRGTENEFFTTNKKRVGTYVPTIPKTGFQSYRYLAKNEKTNTEKNAAEPLSFSVWSDRTGVVVHALQAQAYSFSFFGPTGNFVVSKVFWTFTKTRWNRRKRRWNKKNEYACDWSEGLGTNHRQVYFVLLVVKNSFSVSR